MKATIWHNPNCGTSRKTLEILETTHGVEVSVIDYTKVGFERAKLLQLFKDANLTPQQALRTRGSRADALGLLHESDNNRILDEMTADGMLVERPFVETDKGVRLCRPQDRVHEIL